MATPTQPPPAPAADAVLTFLESVGRRSEAELYLELFRRLPKESFALVAPGAPVVRQGLGGFVEQLRFLSELGLYAPVLLGLFDPDTAEVSRARLDKRLGSARMSVTHHAASDVGLVDGLRDALRGGCTPLMVVDQGAGAEMPERLAWVGRLAADLSSRKLVLLRRHGGLHVHGDRRREVAQRHLLPIEGSSVSVVNLRSAAKLLLSLLGKSDARLLAHVQGLLAHAEPARLVVSITTPLDLLRELFTVKGAGTLVKRGSAIERHEGYDAIDRERLTGLLSASFGHSLHPRFFDKQPLAVYVEQEFRGAAVVHPGHGAPYLSKFAVEPLAQGEGVGRDLWQALSRDFPQLYWRTRIGNPTAATTPPPRNNGLDRCSPPRTRDCPHA